MKTRNHVTGAALLATAAAFAISAAPAAAASYGMLDYNMLSKHCRVTYRNTPGISLRRTSAAFNASTRRWVCMVRINGRNRNRTIDYAAACMSARGTRGYELKNNGNLVICNPGKAQPDRRTDTTSYHRLKREIAGLHLHQRRLTLLRNRLYRGYVAWRSCERHYNRAQLSRSFGRYIAYYRATNRPDMARRVIQRARAVGRFTAYCKRLLKQRSDQAGRLIWQKKNQLARIARRAQG